MLPNHAQKQQVLTNITDVYNNAVKIVQEDAAKVAAKAAQELPKVEAAAEHAVAEATPVVEHEAEQIVKDL
jgi:hypothetical protein